MGEPANATKPAKRRATATGTCSCGGVEIEIDVPALWAWHDHSNATQRAQGCACATFVGCWKSKVRIAKGEKRISRFEDGKTGQARSFCSRCGTPLLFERPRAPKMVNIPRALFDTRTGREPRYHIAIEEMPDWAWRGEKLVPLKNYPGVMWTGGRRRKPQADPGELF